jgi:hypothetical protein
MTEKALTRSGCEIKSGVFSLPELLPCAAPQMGTVLVVALRIEMARARMLRPFLQTNCLLICVASGLVFVATSSSGSLASLSGASVPAVGWNLTLSFDAKPAYSEFYSIQPGYRCFNGTSAGIRTSPSAAFVRDDSPGNVRHGEY